MVKYYISLIFLNADYNFGIPTVIFKKYIKTSKAILVNCAIPKKREKKIHYSRLSTQCDWAARLP